jgi:hypothetical protein
MTNQQMAPNDASFLSQQDIIGHLRHDLFDATGYAHIIPRQV